LKKVSYLLSIGLMIVLLGCGSASTVTTPSTPAPAKEAAQLAKVLTAEGIGNGIKANVPTMNGIVVYTEDTDTNKLLGRPNQYISKVSFADTRTEQLSKDYPTGGSVEVFANPQDAKTRETYVDGISKSSPMFTQYLYLKGNVLLRIDGVLTPTQAKEYETAFGKIAATQN